MLQVQLHRQFLLTFFHHSVNIFKIFHFSPLLSTLTLPNLKLQQFPFYNCKLPFTTAEIVISCTSKYALEETVIAKMIYTNYNSSKSSVYIHNSYQLMLTQHSLDTFLTINRMIGA